MAELFAFLGIKSQAFFAGLIGGVVSVKLIAADSWVERILLVIGGAFAAGYGEPLITGYFAIKSGAGGIAFMVGIFAMSAAKAVMDFISDPKGLRALVERKV